MVAQAPRDKSLTNLSNLSMSELQEYYQSQQQTTSQLQVPNNNKSSARKITLSKKQLINDELTKWAASFRVKRESAADIQMQQRKTMQSFTKPKSSLEIDPEQQQALIMRVQQQ